MPIPKKPKNGILRLRQFFQVPFRDQVAWIAVVNVIGPTLDRLLPAWVYGYRLYRSPYAPGSPKDSQQLEKSYTHWSGNLYRDFKDSFPLYRRHFEQAARCAVGAANELSSDGLPKGYIHPQYVPSFTKPSFWRTTRPRPGNPYFASFDFKEFYPSINLDVIKTNLSRYCAAYRDEPAVQILIDSLLTFRVDASKISNIMQEASEPPSTDGAFKGLPTGLLVAGFLANVAMLAVDLIVDRETTRRKVAHFRFVDDHTFLASSDGELWSWLTWYKAILDESNLGVEINEEKTDPPALGLALKESQESHLGRLKNLLLDDLPKAEIEIGTRRAFAATRIATLAPWLSRETPTYRRFQEDSISLERKIVSLRRRLEARSSSDSTDMWRGELARLESRLRNIKLREDRSIAARNKSDFRFLLKAFQKEPEKPALLRALFTFCRSTGHAGMQAVFDELGRNKESPQGRYLRAQGISMLSKSMFSALKTVLDQTALRSATAGAIAHLEDIVAIDAKDLSSDGSECFQEQALDALRVSLASAFEVLKEVHAVEPLMKGIRVRCDELKVTLWSDVAIGRKSDGWPIWAWWAEENLQSLGNDDPTAVWKRIAGRLDSFADREWHLLQLYPRRQPKLMKTLKNRASKWRKEDAGWLWDAISYSGFTASQRSRASQFNKIIAKMMQRNESKTKISLGKWARLASELVGRDPFDPRGTEWTALEIFRRILDLVNRDRLSLRQLTHIGIEVAGVPVDGLLNTNLSSWDDWRPYVRSHMTVSVATHGLSDYRFVPFSKSGADHKASMFVALGLLLLGLLRHDFDPPNVWNVEGHRGPRLGSVFWHVRNLSVSSLTASMLDFCLAPRNFERRVRGDFSGSDSRQDKAKRRKSGSLDALIEASALAQNILESHQTSVVQREPRQLIPVDVHQLPLLRAIRGR